jgi:tetratricopeptide (TPR) repeat protein
VPAIAQRMEQIRRSVDGGAASAMLERARKLGAKSLDRRHSKKRDEASKEAPEPEGDWLQFALALDKRDGQAWRDLVQIYGMLRMLEAIGTTSAVRELISAYGYFGELVRIDLQRAIERLKDKAVPALIEAREHDAKKVRDWARRLLDSMGRAIPGEAIATTDAAILADVLMAFGRVKDIDAARVILSFISSDRVQLRKAARQALVALGEPASWQMKDAFESVTGNKPPRNWDHKRLAQELFRLHDRSKMTAVYELMGQGQEFAKKGELASAVGSFDQVLARSPLFERRKEMAPVYVAHAAQLERDERVAEALLALRKARRLDPDADDRAKIDSRIAYLEGRQLVDKGTPDPFILKRAVELDSENREARDLLLSLEERTVRVERATKRYAAAGAIGLGAVAAMIWLLRRRERSDDNNASDAPSRVTPNSELGQPSRSDTANTAPKPDLHSPLEPHAQPSAGKAAGTPPAHEADATELPPAASSPARDDARDAEAGEKRP